MFLRTVLIILESEIAKVVGPFGSIRWHATHNCLDSGAILIVCAIGIEFNISAWPYSNRAVRSFMIYRKIGHRIDSYITIAV